MEEDRGRSGNGENDLLRWIEKEEEVEVELDWTLKGRKERRGGGSWVEKKMVERRMVVVVVVVGCEV